ncbi:MAG: isopeptide-forming domain-containing fimbrial protein, partial [Actinomycetia bacterium]|nr:isopeptide-forming domain-containing fimbrial protein [Actinomycetes bacterium]
ITDALPGDLTWVGNVAGISGPAPAVDLSGAPSVVFRWDSLTEAAASYSFTFQASLGAAVNPDEVITNTAGLTYDSLPADDDPDEKDYGPVSDNATVGIDQPEISKTITASSEAFTTLPEAALGETLAYTVTITVPEGQSPSVTLADTADAGLTIVSVDSITPHADLSTSHAGGFAGVRTDAVIGGGGSTLSLPFDTITNANTDNASDETIEVVYTVRVDAASASDGDQLNNNAVWTWSLGSVSDAAPDVDVVEPALEIFKGVSATGGGGSLTGSAGPPENRNLIDADAGDVVTFTVTVRHTAASHIDAFDLEITDALPGDLTWVGNVTGISGPAPTVDLSGAPSVVFRWDSLTEAAASYSFTFQTSLDNTVNPGAVLTNTGHLTWDSLPGDGDPAEKDYGPVSDNATVTIGSPTLDKTVAATSEATTTANEHTVGVDDLTVGETATFHITASIPEGTTPSVVFIDTLPYTNGVMEVVSSRPVSIGGNTNPGNDFGGNLVTDGGLGVDAPCIHSDVQLGDGIDETVTCDFGEVINTPDGLDTVDDQIVVEVVARLKDVVANVDTDQLTNGVLLQFGPGLDRSASADVEVVEPLLVIDKSGDVNSGDAGDVVTFTVNIQHTGASTADAFDLVITDVIPGDMAYVAASLTNTGALAPATLVEALGTITATWAAFPRGSVGEFTFQVELTPSVAPNTTVTNTAGAAWDTLPADGDPEERDHTDNDDHGVLITLPGAVKTVFATSEASSGSGINGPEDDLTIGERATYRFIFTLPEGTSANLVVSDQLPTATSVLSA